MTIEKIITKAYIDFLHKKNLFNYSSLLFDINISKPNIYVHLPSFEDIIIKTDDDERVISHDKIELLINKLFKLVEDGEVSSVYSHWIKLRSLKGLLSL